MLSVPSLLNEWESNNILSNRFLCIYVQETGLWPGRAVKKEREREKKGERDEGREEGGRSLSGKTAKTVERGRKREREEGTTLK